MGNILEAGVQNRDMYASPLSLSFFLLTDANIVIIYTRPTPKDLATFNVVMDLHPQFRELVNTLSKDEEAFDEFCGLVS